MQVGVVTIDTRNGLASWLSAAMDERAYLLQLGRAHQVQLHPAAVKAITAFTAGFDPRDRPEMVSRVFDAAVAKTGGRVLDAAKVAEAIASITQNEHSSRRHAEVIMSPPRIVADPLRATITADSDPGAKRVTLCAERQNRVAVAFLRQSRVMTLTRIRALEGYRIGDEVSVLGFLRKSNAAARPRDVSNATVAITAVPPAAASGISAALDDVLSVEDVDARVAVDLLELSSTGLQSHLAGSDVVGYICPGMVVIATGVWTGKRIDRARLRLPAEEPRARSMVLLGNRNFFGGQKAPNTPQQPESATVCVVSDLNLTSKTCVAAFRRMLETCEAQAAHMDLPALTFVLCGTFVPTNGARYADVSYLDSAAASLRGRVRDAFDALAHTIVAAAPKVSQQSAFVFVPGPEDITASLGGWPQRPLSKSVASSLTAVIPHATLAPNPCRIRTGGCEMIVARADLDKRFARAAVVPPSPSSPAFEHLARTIVKDGNLCASDGINPADAALLGCYPLPHMLCVCDVTTQWLVDAEGTPVFNPGPFAATSTFAWCSVAEGTVDFNRVSAA
jgi:hypothetical protein